MTSTPRRPGADIARRLAGICGARFARPAGAADGVAGAAARWVAAPGTTEAVTEVVRLAADHDLSVVARGAGTKLDWGATPSRLDIVLDTGRLAGMRHQPAGELVAEVGAGTPVRAVQPIPASRIWVTRSVWTPLEVHDLMREIHAADLHPTAIEVDLPGGPGSGAGHRPDDHGGLGRGGSGSLVVLMEGGPVEVAERVTRLATLIGGDVRAAGSPPAWWRRYPFQPDEVALRIEVPSTDLHAAVYALRDAAGQPVPVRGSAGIGVVHAALPAATPPDRVAAILAGVRAVLVARAGRCLVVAAPAPVRELVDLWGELPDLPLLRRVKERFDPARRLAPGRFPGGI